MERGMDTAEAEERLGHDVGWEFMIAAGKKERKGLVWCHIFKSASSRYVMKVVASRTFEHAMFPFPSIL